MTESWLLRAGALCALGVAAIGFSPSPASAVEMTIATFHPRSGTADVESLYKFKELVEDYSAGDVEVKVFYGGTLGGERELVEQLKLGTVHLCLGGWATRGAYLTSVMPWGVPYLFSSQEQIRATIKGRIGDAIKAKMAAEGIIWSGVYFRGNRQLTTNRNIKVPTDLEGIKVRLPENPDWIVVWKAFKTLPVPIPSPEIFGSLQTGVVDAQENPVSSNYNRKLWEVQKYTVWTNHIIDMNTFLMSKTFVDGLTPEQQGHVKKAADDALAWATKFSMDKEAELIADMKKHGMEFLTPDLAPFQKVALSTMDFFQSKWEPWVIDEVKKVLK